MGVGKERKSEMEIEEGGKETRKGLLREEAASVSHTHFPVSFPGILK